MAMTREKAGVSPRAWADGVLNRHPAVGFAAGVVRGGSLAFFHGRGFADVASGARVDAGTVFRVGSVTKVFTAVAVMQLHERGLIDLDAPASAYLRAYALVPARPGWRPPTVRHLLTHTAGIPEVRHVADLLHPEAGPFGGRPPILSVPYGEPLPALARHLRGGLRIVAEPGTAFAYSNLGFATLGQIVEDVTGTPLARVLTERVLDPLGMTDTGFDRPDRLASRRAAGYVAGRRGVRPVADRDWIGAGCGGLYSTPRDLARFAAALLGGGGPILRPETLATMAEPHFRPDPRLPGWGLGFARGDLGGHRTAGHDGILPGFNTTLLLAPDDGLAVIALTNGSPGAFGWLATESAALLRDLLGAPPEELRTDVPQRPELWSGLCGRYRLPARISDLRGRLALAGGAEVLVRGGRLTLRAPVPVRALRRGLPLHPDDPDDPYAFRLDLSPFGQGTARLVFAPAAAALHLDLGGQPVSLFRRSSTWCRSRR